MDDSSISMLDLITNLLAAVLILFFIMSAFQPPPPRPRVCGSLVIDVDLQDRDAAVAIWSQPPGAGEPDHRLLDDEIPDSARVVGNGACGDGLDQLSADGELWIPRVMLYKGLEGENRKIAIVRDPRAGKWFAGLLYKAHPDLTQAEQPRYATVRVWHRRQAQPQLALIGETTLESTTDAARGFLEIEEE